MPCRRFIKSQFENCVIKPAQNHAPQKTALALSVCKTAPLARKIRSSHKRSAMLAKVKFAAYKIKPRHSKANLSFWNSDLLSRVDEVRVLDNFAVGVENNLVFIRVAVEFLRDFR